MIKTLKSELNLRPTYDELIGMIEAQGDPNRPSIETVIDRRATIFRNNQFGSQFDNIDFLGLKKREEDRARENLRQAQLKNAEIQAGTPRGTINLRAMGFETPEAVYDLLMYGEEEQEMTREEATRIRTEMERDLQGQREVQQATASSARSGLDEAHRQSLPAGVELHRMNTGGTDDMPPLVNIEEGEEEEDFEDDPELIPADDDETTKAPNQARRHKETIDYSTKITKWQDKSVQEDDIGFQLFLRGIELTPEQEEEISKLKVKGKGRSQTRKDYLINYVDRLIQTGKWTDQVNDQLLQKRMIEWREMKKGKGSSPSSGGIGSAIVSGAKEIGGAVLEAGKEAVKEAVVAGARSAVMRII